MNEWVEEEVEGIRHALEERVRWPLWSVDEFVRGKEEGGWKSRFESLREEVVVEEVYLGVVLEGDVDIGGGRVGGWLEALEVSIQSSLNVLRHLELGGEEEGGGWEEMRQEQEEVMRMKEKVFEVLLAAYPTERWRRNRLLGGRVKEKERARLSPGV